MQYSQRSMPQTHLSPQRRKRQSRRKHPFAISILALLIIYITTVSLWPIRLQVAASLVPLQSTTRPVTLPWPTEGMAGLSAPGYGVLGQSGSDKSVPIASITKTITALVVLEAKPLQAGEQGPTLTLTQADADLYSHYLAIDGTIAPASNGFRISQYDAMRAMLLPSANNYADTLASWAYGSLGDYVVAANAFLEKHELTGTSVADASGFSPESKSTAKDLLAISAMVLDVPVLRDIVSQESANIPGIGTLYNTNSLLGELGIMGIKTGTTDEAGRCLLFASEHTVGSETVTVIGVVLGATSYQSLNASVRSLLAAAQQSFEPTILASTDEVVARYAAPWGAQIDAVAKTDLVAAQWPEKALKATVNIEPITAGSDPKDVGIAGVEGHSDSLSVNIHTTAALSGPNILWRATHPLQVFGF